LPGEASAEDGASEDSRTPGIKSPDLTSVRRRHRAPWRPAYHADIASRQENL
jgi:hypothetical protein